MTIESCTLCPRRCGALRDEARGNGFCGMPATPAVCRAALHFGEEPVLCEAGGSGTVFFCGCTMRCSFCQNAAISRGYVGRPTDAEGLCRIFKRLEAEGAQNISLVTATPFVLTVVEALKTRPVRLPVVWNSSGYESVETLKLLDGLVDIYLPDFKYATREAAAKYSATPDYAEHALPAIAEMLRQTGPAVVEKGVMKRGVIIRHLMLPGNLKETLAVIGLMKERFPRETLVSLMRQYTPPENPAFPELGRRVTTSEYDRAVAALIDAGFTRGYTQDRASATADFVPEWDML